MDHTLGGDLIVDITEAPVRVPDRPRRPPPCREHTPCRCAPRRWATSPPRSHTPSRTYRSSE
ncbi:hypothetical protein L1I79_31775 [Strepomyces sp. STD 3.1]|nr:hypothetical protein [Streptomyces sp. STD 3.1]